MLIFDQTINANPFVYPQWMITPFPNNKFYLILTGIVEINVTCVQHKGWHRDTVRIVPDLSKPFGFAGFDTPNTAVTLQADQYASYGTINSIFDESASVNAGFAVDAFRPFFSSGFRGIQQGSGIDLDIAVQDRDATLYRVGYQLMAIGEIQTQPIPPIQ